MLKVILVLFFVVTITIRGRTSRDRQEALFAIVYNFKKATISVELLKLSANIQITSVIKKSSRIYRISDISNCNRYFQ